MILSTTGKITSYLWRLWWQSLLWTCLGLQGLVIQHHTWWSHFSTISARGQWHWQHPPFKYWSKCPRGVWQPQVWLREMPPSNYPYYSSHPVLCWGWEEEIWQGFRCMSASFTPFVLPVDSAFGQEEIKHPSAQIAIKRRKSHGEITGWWMAFAVIRATQLYLRDSRTKSRRWNVR